MLAIFGGWVMTGRHHTQGHQPGGSTAETSQRTLLGAKANVDACKLPGEPFLPSSASCSCPPRSLPWLGLPLALCAHVALPHACQSDQGPLVRDDLILT